MDPLYRQSQRILAGVEDNVTSTIASDPPGSGWTLALQPGGPKSGSVNVHDGYEHNVSEAVADGGTVYTQDRRIHDALLGLGGGSVYTVANTRTVGSYIQQALALNPKAHWRMDETSGARVANDLTGPGPLNLIANPLTDADTLDGWGTASSWRINTGAKLSAVTTPVLGGTYAGRCDTPGLKSSEGLDCITISLTQGFTYNASVYLRGVNGGESVQLMFGDSTVGTVTFSVVLSASAWTRVSVNLTAGATHVTGVAVRTASTASIGFYITQAMVVQGTTAPTFYRGNGGRDGNYVGSTVSNRISNPSFETNLSGWTANANATTFARQNGWTASGAWSARVTGTPTAGSVLIYSPSFAVAAGQIVSARANINILAATTATGAGPNIVIQYDNGSGAWTLGSDTGATSSWVAGAKLLTVVGTGAPATATLARLVIGGSTAAAETIDMYVDAVSAILTNNPVAYSNVVGVTLGANSLAADASDKAVLFSRGYVTLPNVVPLPGDFSLVTLCNLSSEGVEEPYWDNQIVDIAGYAWLVRNTGWYVTLPGSAVQQGSSPNNVGVVTHWALVRQGGGFSLYRNGLSMVSNAPCTPNANVNVRGIGSSGGLSWFFHGTIDETSVYDYALSSEQIVNLYDAV